MVSMTPRTNLTIKLRTKKTPKIKIFCLLVRPELSEGVGVTGREVGDSGVSGGLESSDERLRGDPERSGE